MVGEDCRSFISDGKNKVLDDLGGILGLDLMGIPRPAGAVHSCQQTGAIINLESGNYSLGFIYGDLKVDGDKVFL